MSTRRKVFAALALALPNGQRPSTKELRINFEVQQVLVLDIAFLGGAIA